MKQHARIEKGYVVRRMEILYGTFLVQLNIGVSQIGRCPVCMQKIVSIDIVNCTYTTNIDKADDH